MSDDGTMYCCPQGHSSLTPIYLYMQEVTFGMLSTKTHTTWMMLAMMLKEEL